MKRHTLILLGVFVLAVTAAGANAECTIPKTVAFQHPSPRDVVAGFGMQRHPLLGVKRAHTGIDYAGPVGDPIVAPAAGVVKSAAFSGESGNLILIEHSSELVTHYAHMTAQFAVQVGDCVKQGQIIGAIGNTGLSAGPHLHFEVIQNGTAIDPASVLPAFVVEPVSAQSK